MIESRVLYMIKGSHVYDKKKIKLKIEAPRWENISSLVTRRQT